jgi:protein-L-isoaspartate(D-aspartate) O-methyltransferase
MSNKGMIINQILRRRINDLKVLDAFMEVDRIHFVPEELSHIAYTDQPLAVGNDQTISQPYMVAYMTDELRLRGDEKVLEIGTGTGYQTAILSKLCKEVYTIERIEELAIPAKERLKNIGCCNINFRIGNGYAGWSEHAPYDRIIVTAAPEEVPEELLNQLEIGGFIMLPIGKQYHPQTLLRIFRNSDGFYTEDLGAVAFVPMVKD